MHVLRSINILLALQYFMGKINVFMIFIPEIMSKIHVSTSQTAFRIDMSQRSDVGNLFFACSLKFVWLFIKIFKET